MMCTRCVIKIRTTETKPNPSPNTNSSPKPNPNYPTNPTKPYNLTLYGVHVHQKIFCAKLLEEGFRYFLLLFFLYCQLHARLLPRYETSL